MGGAQRGLGAVAARSPLAARMADSAEAAPPPRFSVGLDIGGTLSKLCVYQPYDPHWQRDGFLDRLIRFLHKSKEYGNTGQRDTELEMAADMVGGSFHFIKFRTKSIKVSA